ncbi:MAG: phosphate acyltransferase PlsX [Gemmatimonadetes bacterium]|nr:phosphate acyltransferase PlsX [Gemmatimonadota bacterium]
MRIALDAMGTDRAPANEVAGAQAAVAADPDLEVVLVGHESVVRPEMERIGTGDRVQFIHAPDQITTHDAPASALRKKPKSSIAIGLTLHKEGHVDAFVSAGSTGAVMAGSLFILRPLAGVDRPTVATLLPTAKGPTLMLDAGANIECKAGHLLQFAQLGGIYMQDLLDIESPRIGLLNVGTEPTKGTEEVQEAFQLLDASPLNFVGNVEGRDIIHHACDVLVCDGFPGNILLKFYESVAGFLIEHLRSRLDEGGLGSVDLEDAVRFLDYQEYGGAPLLGVNGVSIICHGESSPRAIQNAIDVAAQAVRNGTLDHMTRELQSGAEREA